MIDISHIRPIKVPVSDVARGVAALFYNRHWSGYLATAEAEPVLEGESFI